MSENEEIASCLTIRLIRSFKHRNFRNIVLRNVDLQITGSDLANIINSTIKTTTGLPPPFKTFNYDTLKIETKAHGSKTNNPVMNCENDEELIINQNISLKESGIRNETEINFFLFEDYENYKVDFSHQW